MPPLGRPVARTERSSVPGSNATVTLARPVTDTTGLPVVVRAQPAVLPHVETSLINRQFAIRREGANVDVATQVVGAAGPVLAHVLASGAVAQVGELLPRTVARVLIGVTSITVAAMRHVANVQPRFDPVRAANPVVDTPLTSELAATSDLLARAQLGMFVPTRSTRIKGRT